MPIAKYAQTFENGFWPTAPKTGQARVPHSIRDARNILLEPDFSVVSAKNLAAALHASLDRLYLVNNRIGYIATGSITFYQQNSYWFTGSGNSGMVVVTAGVGGTGPGGYEINLGMPTSEIRFLLNGMVYIAGFIAPAAPALQAAMTSGKLTGSVAVQLTARRKETGAESNASIASNAITFSGQEATVTFPACLPGQNSWGFYSTFTGFGEEGPFFLLKDIDIGTMTGQVPENGGQLTLSWFNSELSKRQPPTDHNPPLPGLFVAAINNIMLNIGVFGGVSIQPSNPNDPEGYSFSRIITTSPPEIIIGILGRPAENEFVFWTADSIQALVPTGVPSAPVLIRARWPVSGVQNKSGLCYAQSDIFCASGQGLVHIPDGGAPEKLFARAVQKFVRLLGIAPADIAVGYDERYDHVVFFLGSSNLALIYNRQIEKWSPPLLLSGQVKSTVTLNGVLYVTIGASLYQWESGVGGDWFLQHDWADDPDSSSDKTIIGVQAVLNTKGIAATVEFQSNLIETVLETLIIPAVAMQTHHNTDWLAINKACKQYNCTIRSIGADHELVEVNYQYLYTGLVRANT